jgi:predicted RNase H-like HicB family nuclease
VVRVYRALLKQDADGAWIVSVPEVPGCHGQGKTIHEAMARSREALRRLVDDADEAKLEAVMHDTR